MSILIDAWRQGGDHFPCFTSRQRTMSNMRAVHAEVFTAMVIADLLITAELFPDLAKSIVSMLERRARAGDRFFFFEDAALLPADADCTALGFSLLLTCRPGMGDQAQRALDLIINNTKDGVVQTYFDPTGERDGIVDPVVCCNALYLAFQLGRARDVRSTFDFVYRALMERSYLKGTRYYHSPESFLYFMGRLVHTFPETQRLLLEPLRTALRERQGTTSHTIDLSQRILLAAWLNLPSKNDLDRLLAARDFNGGWPADSLFRYGRRKIFFGSHSLASAFALAALSAQPIFGAVDPIRRKVSLEREVASYV